jgi:tetratricopeptide (TPR) repeat protein
LPDEKTLKDEISKLEALLKETPESEEFYRLANAYTRGGRFVDAIKVSKKGLKRHPELIPGYVALGRSLFGAGKLAKAAKVLRHSLDLPDPGSEPYRLLGEILLRLAAPSEAVAILERAVEREITDKPIQVLLERARQTLDQDQTNVVEKEGELPRGIGNVAVAGTIGVTGEVEIPMELGGDLEKTPRVDKRKDAAEGRPPSTLPEGILDGRVETTRKVRDPALRRADWNDIDDGWEQELDARNDGSFPDVGSDVDGPFDRRPRVEIKLPPLTDPLTEGMPPLPSDLEDSDVVSLPDLADLSDGAEGAGPAAGLPDEELTRPLPTIPMEFGEAGGILPEVAETATLERESPVARSEPATNVLKQDEITTEQEAVTSVALKRAPAPERPKAARVPPHAAQTLPVPQIAGPAPEPASSLPSLERFDPALAETLPGSSLRPDPREAASPEGGVNLADLMSFDDVQGDDSREEPAAPEGPMESGLLEEALPDSDMVLAGIEPHEHRRRRRWPWVMVVFILFSAAGGGGVYYWKHFRSTTIGTTAQQAGGEAELSGTLEAYRAALTMLKAARKQGGSGPQVLAELELISALSWLHYRDGDPPRVTASHSPWGHVAARAAVKLASHKPEAARPLLKARPKQQQQQALRSYLLAWTAWLEGEREQAERQAQLALEQQPRLANAHVLIGHLGREVGYLEQAETSYRRALEVSPGHPLAGLCLAAVLLERGSTVAEVEKELTRNRSNALLRAWQGLVVGERAVRRGELKEGSRRLQDAIAVAPPRAALLYHGVRVLILAGRIDAALVAWERLQRIRARRDLAMGLLDAELAAAQGLDKRVLSKLKELDELPARGRLLRAAALVEVGRVEEAAETLKKDTSDPARAYRAYAAAVASAEAPLDPLRKLAKESPQAQLLLSRVLFTRGDLDAAFKEAQGLARRPLHRDRAAVLLARINMQRNKAGAARVTLEEVVSRSPSFLPAGQALGQAYLELGRYHEAVQRLIGVQKAGRVTLELAVSLASGQALVGRSREATSALKHARALGASQEQINRVTGLIRLAEENYRDAVALLKTSTGNSVVAQVALGRAQLEDGQTAAARASLTRAMAADPSHPLPHLWLGHLHARSKSPNALFHFKTAILRTKKRRHFPHALISEAQIGIARYHLMKRQPKLAIASLNAAVRIDSSSAEAYRVLGQTLISARRFRPARKALSKCLELDPSDTTALFLLGTAARSHPKYARHTLRRFLELEPTGKRAKLAQRQLRRLR